jgi:hypothetical protein
MAFLAKSGLSKQREEKNEVEKVKIKRPVTAPQVAGVTWPMDS